MKNIRANIEILNPDDIGQILRIRDIVREEPARKQDGSRIDYLLEPNGSRSFDKHSLEMLTMAEATTNLDRFTL